MSLPKQIQDQIAQGAALAAQLDPASPQNIAAAAAAAQPVTAPVNEPPANQNEPEPAAPPAPQNGDNWEQKYKILQGKYNAEVPRMAQELREQQDQMRILMEQVQALSDAPRTEVQFNGVGNIDPATREEYGEEFFNIVAQTAMQAINPALSQMAQQMEDLRRGLIGTQSVVQKTEHQIFLEQLDSQLKSWRTLNKDEGFKAWLLERDPFTGQTRKHLLDDAVRNRDVSRALAFFNGYEAEHGKGANNGSQAPAPRETSLEQFAAPGAGRSAQAPAPSSAADEIWTRPEIKAFYDDVRRGKFVGRDAEKLAIEQRIAAAASQGRVRG